MTLPHYLDGSGSEVGAFQGPLFLTLLRLLDRRQVPERAVEVCTVRLTLPDTPSDKVALYAQRSPVHPLTALRTCNILLTRIYWS